ncbi:thioredoxin peroxidase [Anopheles sinensis]|uniref:Thioredoxin peroxidase n=1 Tax=Anopheles sinensis TaxID=74873 RepID=A0A084WBU4_ANOSI|nr:thioredoxin peroxidase [Anopheles sinensis]
MAGKSSDDNPLPTGRRCVRSFESILGVRTAENYRISMPPGSGPETNKDLPKPNPHP